VCKETDQHRLSLQAVDGGGWRESRAHTLVRPRRRRRRRREKRDDASAPLAPASLSPSLPSLTWALSARGKPGHGLPDHAGRRAGRCVCFWDCEQRVHALFLCRRGHAKTRPHAHAVAGRVGRHSSRSPAKRQQERGRNSCVRFVFFPPIRQPLIIHPTPIHPLLFPPPSHPSTSQVTSSPTTTQK
jgi:hypothetical protein